MQRVSSDSRPATASLTANSRPIVPFPLMMSFREPWLCGRSRAIAATDRYLFFTKTNRVHALRRRRSCAEVGAVVFAERSI
jgi:hypothetical protein